MKKQRTTSKRPLAPTLLAIAGIILVVLAAGVLVLDRGGADPEENPNNQAGSGSADVHDEQGIPYPEVPRVSLAEAKARYDASTAVFVDVRSSQEYEAAHIPGALSLPLAGLQAGSQELPADALIFLYCT